jgi:integrase
MITLRQDAKGNFTARKRLPNDVREEYGRRFGQRLEAKFYAAAGDRDARQKFRDWETEVEGRIALIRAERTGEGIALTARQARALAGEWYEWFIAKHPESDERTWEALQDDVSEALQAAAGFKRWEQSDPDTLWKEDAELRKRVRPVLADVGKTAQFLAMKGLVLNNEARDRFLDWLYDDLAAALHKLKRVTQGDYRDDGYAKRFPKFEGLDKGETPQQLFEAWVVETQPAQSTIETWRYPFKVMTEHFKDRSAASIRGEEAEEWIKSLIGKRSRGTVRKNWLTASRTIFNWAVEQKRLPRNPFAAIKIKVPKKQQLRETKAFLPEERRTILRASLSITVLDTPDKAAQRWVPWICAYTGARPSEVTQLRKEDVIERDSIHAIRITPDAGTVKNKRTRVVPLHEHLIAQGFLTFVAEQIAGPLFYKPSKPSNDPSALNPKKPRYLQTRQRLAEWVRGLGITDAELMPNHAWRHTFKQIADRAGISERMSDYITGHAHKSEGAKYGAPVLADMADAFKKFPRYEV